METFIPEGMSVEEINRRPAPKNERVFRPTIGDDIKINSNFETRAYYFFDPQIFYNLLAYTNRAMRQIVGSAEADHIRQLLDKGSTAAAVFNRHDPFGEGIAAFEDMFGSLGAWDIKYRTEFRQRCLKVRATNGRKKWVFPIPGDYHYLYDYDIWGNILFGYAGGAAGMISYITTFGGFYDDLRNNRILEEREIAMNKSRASSGSPSKVVLEGMKAAVEATADTVLSTLNDNVGVQIGADLYSASKPGNCSPYLARRVRF